MRSIAETLVLLWWTHGALRREFGPVWNPLRGVILLLTPFALLNRVMPGRGS